MTQEEKQLLLKDLCSRLPYGVKVKYYRDKCDGTLKAVNFKFKTVWITADSGSNDSLDFESIGKGVWQLKPYLHPMSSMTDEEKEDLQNLHDIISDENYDDGYSPAAWDAISEFNDYCHAHHLDNRGLIGKGLALEAPEHMYD